jgi:hypothetical protein
MRLFMDYLLIKTVNFAAVKKTIGGNLLKGVLRSTCPMSFLILHPIRTP